MSTTRASIVIPMHNAAEHLSRMVGCLQAQTYTNFEVLLVDDASTDDTLSVANNLVGEDERFVVIAQTPQAGPGSARNAGIDAAGGDYLFFFDVDDIVAPNIIESALSKAEQTAADIVIFQMNHIDTRDGSVHPSPDAWDASRYPDVFDPAQHAETLFGDFRNWPVDKAFRRSFVHEANLHFPALYRTEDLAFTCAALASAKSIALLDQVLYTYRIGAVAASTQNRDAAPLDFLDSARVLKTYLEEHNLMDTYRSTYTQWVGLACCVNVLELDSFDAFKQAYNALHDGGLHELQIDASSRTAIGADNPNDTTKAAGDIENADIWCALDAIEHCELDEGTFHLLTLYRHIQQRHWQFLVDDVRSSVTYKIGKTLLAPLRVLRK